MVAIALLHSVTKFNSSDRFYALYFPFLNKHRLVRWRRGGGGEVVSKIVVENYEIRLNRNNSASDVEPSVHT